MAKLCVTKEFTALHGTKSVKRDRFKVSLSLSGAVEGGFVKKTDHEVLHEALAKVLSGLEGSYLDDVVGRATNENIALYVLHSLAGLCPDVVSVHEGTGQVVEVSPCDLRSRNYPAYLALSQAQSLLLRERPSDALAVLSTALLHEPRSAEAYNLIGRCHRYLGQHDLAAESYLKAISIDAALGEAYRNLGNAYYELGRYDDMVWAFSRAIELMPDSALAVNNRGFGYQKMGLFRQARDDHLRAVALDPNYAEAYLDLSEAHLRLGETELAEKALERRNGLVSSGTDTYAGYGAYRIDGSTASRYVAPDLYYGIPVYNEEGHLLSCLDSLVRQRFDGRVETLVCLNGCTDNSEREALAGKEKYPELNVRLIHSQKRGKPFAQNQIVRAVTDKTAPIVFVDADVVLDADCIGILYQELRDLKQLIAVGTWHAPIKPRDLSSWERFLYRILYMRAFYSEAEMSSHDVSAYKGFVREKPQPSVSPDFEMRSKIFFHGRTFMLRNAGFFYVPEDANVADDTYLPNAIHTRHGPGTIRTRYDAKVFYQPYRSLAEHFRAYRRVYCDLQRLDRSGIFADSRKMEKTKLDWNYILSRGPTTAAEFAIYKTIVSMERLLYHLLPEKELLELWKYDRK